jgi:hypothetical protein
VGVRAGMAVASPGVLRLIMATKLLPATPSLAPSIPLPLSSGSAGPLTKSCTGFVRANAAFGVSVTVQLVLVPVYTADFSLRTFAFLGGERVPLSWRLELKGAQAIRLRGVQPAIEVDDDLVKCTSCTTRNSFTMGTVIILVFSTFAIALT